MPNNSYNYKELGIDPEMTWGDFETWVKKEWGNNISPDVELAMETHFNFMLNNIMFCKNGNVKTSSGKLIADGVSYKRMQTIIKSLFEG